jgi:hypothetical protein
VSTKFMTPKQLREIQRYFSLSLCSYDQKKVKMAI